MKYTLDVIEKQQIQKLAEQTLSDLNLSSFYRSKVTNKLVKVYLLPSFMLKGNEGQIA